MKNTIIVFFLLLFQILNAQNPLSVSVRINAMVQNNPPKITLNWLPVPIATSYQIQRKLKEDNTWTGPVIIVNNSFTYEDNNVALNTEYEYKITATTTANATAVGYICSGIDIAAKENKGIAILLIDSRFSTTLQNEINQYVDNLEGDGYTVRKEFVVINTPVNTVRQLINNIYSQNPQETKTLILLGRVPVPLSGVIYPDGHNDHLGAWPADVIYGDVNGVYTDNAVNFNSSNTRLRNIPGDGKFDQSFIDSDIELEVGRIDMFSMSGMGNTETNQLRNYLIRNNNYRRKITSYEKRALIDDNFGYFNGESFSSSAWRGFSTIVGNQNVSSADYFGTLSNNSYLFSYGCGAGTYESAAGIGNTNSFSSTPVKSVFTALFGSYFGDWEVSRSFLRAALAGGECLTSVWSGRPNFIFHHMGLGETIGYAVKTSQNNQNLYRGNYGTRFTHPALMGDPTLKADIVQPPANFVASKQGNDALLTWSASNEDNVMGYHIYVKKPQDEKYIKLNSEIITTNSFLHSCLVEPGIYKYMVRVEKKEITPSGSYFNMSTGSIDTMLNTTDYRIQTDFSFFITGNNVEFLSNTTNADNILWDFNNGNFDVVSNPVQFYNDGVYYVTLKAFNTCNIDSVTKIIGIGDVLPPQPGELINFSDTVCGGSQNVQFNFTPIQNTTYVWSYSGTGVTINGNGAERHLSFAQNATSGQLTITPFNVFGNGVPRILNIFVEPFPNAIINGSSNICLGDTVSLSVSGGESFNWNTGETAFFIQKWPTSTTTYSVIVTASNGCTNLLSQTVNVAPIPSAPSISIINGGVNPFCNGSTITLRSSYAGGNEWSNGSQLRDISVSETSELWVRVQNNGCYSQKTFFNALEKPPFVAEINGQLNSCNGSTLISATTNSYPNPITYRWRLPNNSFVFNQSINATQSGVYTLAVYSNDLCPLVSTTANVNIGVIGNPVITANGATNFCQGQSVVISAPNSSGYLWNTGETTQSITVTQTGNYFVQVNSGNCSGTSNTISVNVNPVSVPQISIHSSSTQICNDEVVLISSSVLNQGDNPEYFWFKNNTLIENNNLPQLELDEIFSGDTVYCKLVSDASCAEPYEVISNKIVFDVANCGARWVGTIDENWNEPLNWVPNLIPDETINVNIPVAERYPVLNSNTQCNSISLNGLATLNLNGYELTVYGLPNFNGKIIGHPNSVLNYRGTGNAGRLFFSQQSDSSKSLKKFSIDRDGFVYINDTINIIEELELIKCNLITNNQLRLKADSNYTARISQISNPSDVTVIGGLIVQQFNKRGRTGWVMMSNSVYNDSIISWMDDFATSGFPGSTGYVGDFVSIYSFGENFEYQTPQSSTDSIILGKGYFVYFGDALYNTDNITFDVCGKPHIGDFYFNITSPNPNELSETGWNLVANPYSSPIDWTSPFWEKVLINDVFYIYNNNLEQYGIYSNETGLSINEQTSIIPASQGFWVKTFREGATLKATEEVKTELYQLFNKSNNQNTIPHLKLKLISSNYRDECILAFSNVDSLENLKKCAYKLYSINDAVPSISLLSNSFSYSILTENKAENEIPVLLKMKSFPAAVTIQLNNNVDVEKIFFTDKLLNKKIKISNDTLLHYYFTDSLDFTNRFYINYQNNINYVNDLKGNTKGIFPNPAKNILYISESNISSVNIKDLHGKIVQNSSTLQTKQININMLSAGIYLVELFNEKGVVSVEKLVKYE